MRACSYAWSLPVTWQRGRSHRSIRHSVKSHATRKPDRSVFYRTGVMGDRSLHSGNRNFRPCWLRGPWPGSDDLNMRSWPVLLGAIPDVQIWTSYVKAFESYRQTDKHTYTHIHRVSKKTSTHIIGYKLRNSCPILIIFDIKIPHIIW